MTEQEREHWEHEANARYDDVRERFAGEEVDHFADCDPDTRPDDDELVDIDLDAMDDEEPGDEPDDMTDVEADADTLRSCGWGTDEDYGGCDDHPF